MATQQHPDVDRTYTIDEYMCLAESGERYELVNGRLSPMAPTSWEHGDVGGLLTIYLGQYVLQHGLGRVSSAETAFVLNAETRDVRAADIAFVAAARIPRILGPGPIPFPPDLVVEVISPSDRLTEVRKKARVYQRAGIPLVWVVNPRPRHRTVQVYHPADLRPATLGVDDHLDGEDIVPGFTLPIRTLFRLP